MVREIKAYNMNPEIGIMKSNQPKQDDCQSDESTLCFGFLLRGLLKYIQYIENITPNVGR
jgi:hypothetical protein